MRRPKPHACHRNTLLPKCLRPMLGFRQRGGCAALRLRAAEMPRRRTAIYVARHAFAGVSCPSAESANATRVSGANHATALLSRSEGLRSCVTRDALPAAGARRRQAPTRHACRVVVCWGIQESRTESGATALIPAFSRREKEELSAAIAPMRHACRVLTS